MNSKAIHYLCQKRAAVKWIENVLEISLDQNEDFVKLLVDGILLCRVIQAISPRLMPRISIPDPNAPKRTIMFKNSENISFFIQASIDMGIPRHKKFTLADLQQERPTYTNIRRVIECLEAVCKIANQDSQYDFSIEWPVLEASEQKFSEKEVHEAESLLAQFTIRENKRQEVIKKSQTQNGDFSVAATKNQLFQHIADQKKLYPDNSPKSQRSSLGFKASPIGAPSSPTISSHVPSPAAVAEKLKSSGLTTSSSSAPTTTAPPVTSVTSTASTVPKTVNVVTQTPVTVTSTATPTAVAPTSTTATTASSTTSTATVTTVPKSSTPGTSTPDPKQDRLSTELKAVIKIQRATRRWLERNRQRVRERDNAYRERITQEITKTEVEYLNRLIYLRDQPLKDLREAIAKGSPIISEEEIRAIFSELESIIAYNTQLLNELQVRCKHWKQDTLIGDIFVKFSRFLMIYSQYCINYGDCLEVLNVCKKQPKFKAFLNKLKEHNEEIRLRGLEDYLIRPIQRIPRYSLLIKDMINHTWASHPDYQSLENAYNSMNTVAEKMNEAKRNAENRMKLADIQEKLEGNSNDISAVVKAHRRFVKEGEFTEGMVKKKCALVLYLFNDILAVTRPSKSSGSFFGKQKTIRLQFESSYPLHKLRLKPLDDTPTCTNSFMISTSSEDRLVICASDKETKEDWIAAIIAEKADADKHEKEQEERITSSVSEKVADTKLKLEQQFAFRTSGQYAPVDPDNPGAAGSSSLEDLNVKTGKMSLREKRMKLVQESRSNRLSANVSLTDSGKEKQ